MAAGIGEDYPGPPGRQGGNGALPNTLCIRTIALTVMPAAMGTLMRRQASEQPTPAAHLWVGGVVKLLQHVCAWGARHDFLRLLDSARHPLKKAQPRRPTNNTGVEQALAQTDEHTPLRHTSLQ